MDVQGFSVIKTNDAIVHGTWLEFFERLAVHDWLFPEVDYSHWVSHWLKTGLLPSFNNRL